MKKNLWLILLGTMFLSRPALAEDVYTIYPIPQQQVAVEGTASLTSQVFLICENGIDQATRTRAVNMLQAKGFAAVFNNAPDANYSTIYIGVNGSREAADLQGDKLKISRTVFSQEGKFDRHSVSLAKKDGGSIADVVILGENTDAAFYGLATLEYMLDKGTENLPCVNIYDYADQQSRGLVEGYYGYPYTIDNKKSLMEFMMRHKMNTYLYGAKSDPYHSNYWKQAYPTSITADQESKGWLSQDMIRELSETSAATKVNFVWAIHPGNEFLGSSTVVKDIMSKFKMMYNLGVRQFAVFVDDVSVPNTQSGYDLNAQRVTEIQQGIEAEWNKAGAQPADTVKPLHFVSQIYCTSFAGGETQQYKDFFTALASTPKNVVVYTTGWGVWSVPNSGDLATVKKYLGRDVAWWWNYPCNDNADGQIYTMDTYSNFYDMPSVDSNAKLPSDLQNSLAIVSNPMQQGALSKIPLFSVANYAWNTSGFNNKTSWEASFKAAMSEKYTADFRFLAEYLRWNDPSELNSLISSYKTTLSGNRPQPDKLQEKMSAVLAACNNLLTLKDSEQESDRLLYNDIAPWLLKLRQMSSSVYELLTAASAAKGTDNTAWDTYAPQVALVNALDTAEAYKAYALEGMGSGISVSERASQPAHHYLYPFVKFMKEKAMDGFFEDIMLPTEPTSFSNIVSDKTIARATINDATVTLATSGTLQLNPGEYIGINLPSPVKLQAISMADSLLEKFSVIHSFDGKSWSNFTAANEVPSDFVKYIAFKNTSDVVRPIRITRNNLKLTYPSLPEIAATSGPTGDVWNNNGISHMTDGDYNTFYILNRNQQNGDAYILTLEKETAITDVRICMGTTNGDYMTTGRVQVSTDKKNWTNLRVKGSPRTDFVMTLPQVVKYSDDMSYCDFDGGKKTAKYIRLYLEKANTNKWLRLAEIEVNRQGLAESFYSLCADSEGNALNQLTDGVGYTGTTEETESGIIYRFLQIHPAKQLIVYQAAREGNIPQLQITDDGTSWKDVATLSEHRTTIDITAHPDATAVRITWKGAAPELYEIVEISDKEAPTTVSIEPILTDNGSKAEVVYLNKTLRINSTVGVNAATLHAADGRCLISARYAKEHHISLPVLGLPTGTAVLTLTLSDGSTASMKLMVK